MEAKKSVSEKNGVNKNVPEFMDVKVQYAGDYKGKKYVVLPQVSRNNVSGNLSSQLEEGKILLLKRGFLEKYTGVVMEESSVPEKSFKTAPYKEAKDLSEATIRMKVIGQSKDGAQTFLQKYLCIIDWNNHRYQWSSVVLLHFQHFISLPAGEH